MTFSTPSFEEEPAMSHGKIIVGYYRSADAKAAVAWALDEAARFERQRRNNAVLIGQLQHVDGGVADARLTQCRFG